MLDGNPMITDLSDSNRPQKLSEKFNSLYDNSWTDAYEIVAKQTDDEKMVCGNLLTILKVSETICIVYLFFCFDFHNHSLFCLPCTFF